MMDKPENIPSGKNCAGKTFICPWLYDGYWCKLINFDEDNNNGGIRSVTCRAAYPNGAVVTIVAREVERGN